jgi:hypothetical protein
MYSHNSNYIIDVKYFINLKRNIIFRGKLFKKPNPYSQNITLGSTQSLTEISTRTLPGGIGGPTLKADNLTAICEPTL